MSNDSKMQKFGLFVFVDVVKYLVPGKYLQYFEGEVLLGIVQTVL